MLEISFVYLIKHIDERLYIGISTNPIRRWNQHKSIKRPTSYIDFIIKNEPENFLFEILEENSLQKIFEREIFYIKEYNSLYPNGFNLSPGGKGNGAKFYTTSDGRVVKRNEAFNSKILSSIRNNFFSNKNILIKESIKNRLEY